MANDSVSSISSRPRRTGRAVLSSLCAALILSGCVSHQQPQERATPQPTAATVSAKPSAKSPPRRKAPGPALEAQDRVGERKGRLDARKDRVEAVKSRADEIPVAGQRRRVGEATYYASYFQGRRTASGELYDGQAMTAAHKTLPFGTRVKVTDLDTGDSAVVRINDRGPFVPGRIIDVSERAAQQLGLVDAGVAEVRLQVLE